VNGFERQRDVDNQGNVKQPGHSRRHEQ
jgi:hypothetical protein